MEELKLVSLLQQGGNLYAEVCIEILL